ncbi:membrane-associated protein, putative [Bodo saltans]|uniref:Membrane-associated protein, putative n=1 Tax=Bodo saltans TaxID=75058 RepID=A0A0S4JUY3_BODSA|nr:membrane-associated protein, putative [Bodo saltans]|eukprot:CUG94115.1 membrane-associated protein, putative [Bodo saltans]
MRTRILPLSVLARFVVLLICCVTPTSADLFLCSDNSVTLDAARIATMQTRSFRFEDCGPTDALVLNMPPDSNGVMSNFSFYVRNATVRSLQFSSAPGGLWNVSIELINVTFLVSGGYPIGIASDSTNLTISITSSRVSELSIIPRALITIQPTIAGANLTLTNVAIHVSNVSFFPTWAPAAAVLWCASGFGGVTRSHNVNFVVSDVVMGANTIAPSVTMLPWNLVVLELVHIVSNSSISIQRVALSCSFPSVFLMRAGSTLLNSTLLVEDVVLGLTVSGQRCVNSNATYGLTSVTSLANIAAGSSIVVRRCQFLFAGPLGVISMIAASNRSVVAVENVTVGATFWLNMSGTALVGMQSLDSHSIFRATRNDIAVNGWRSPSDTRIITLPNDFDNLVPYTDAFIPPYFAFRLVFITDASVYLMDSQVLAVGVEGHATLRNPGGSLRSLIVIQNHTIELNVLFLGYFVSIDSILSSCVVNISLITFRAHSNANITMLDFSRAQFSNATNLTMEYWSGNVTNYPNYRRWTMLENIFIKHQLVISNSLVIYRHGTFDALYANSSGTWGWLGTSVAWNNSTLRVYNLSRIAIRCFSQNVLVSVLSATILAYNMTLEVFNVSASVVNASNVCLVCASVHDTSNITVTDVTMYTSTSPISSSTFPTMGIVILKPAGVSLTVVTRCRLTFESATTGGAIGLMTATSMNFSEVHITDCTVTVSQEAGTVSIMSSGISFSSSVTIINSPLLMPTTPLTAVILATTYLIRTTVVVMNCLISVSPTSSLGVVSYLQLMADSQINITNVSSAKGASCWTPSMVGKQAISDALALQLFPADTTSVIPSLFVNFRGASNVEIYITNVVWDVVCTPVLAISGDCVLLAHHETLINVTIHITNTVSTLSSPTFVINLATVGVVLLAAAPQIGVGDLAQPISKSIVSIANVKVVLVNVTLRVPSVYSTTQRVFGVSVDSTTPSVMDTSAQTMMPSVSVNMNLVTIEAPRNITLVNFGILANTESRVFLRNVQAKFYGTATGATTFSSFRCLSFAPLFPTDSPNCTTALNARIDLDAVAINVSGAACTSASTSSTCDHVVADMSPATVTDTSILGLVTSYHVRRVWNSFQLFIAPWGFRFTNQLSPVSDGSALLNVLRLVGSSVNMSGTSLLTVSPPSGSSHTFASPSDALARIGTVSWQQSAGFLFDGSDASGGSSSQAVLSSGALSTSRPLIAIDVDGTVIEKQGEGPHISLTNVVVTADASVDTTATNPASLLGVTVAPPKRQWPFDVVGLSILVNNVTFRLLNGGTASAAVMPQRTTTLVTLSGTPIQRVVIRESVLHLGAVTVRTPTGTDASSEALMVIMPPSWLQQNMSSFPQSSILSNNDIILPSNKDVTKLTFTTAVRTLLATQQWTVPHASSPEESPFKVQCNTINTIAPLMRADPQAIPQNITSVCNTFTEQISLTPTCDAAGGASISVIPASAPLYNVYRTGAVFTIAWVNAEDARFNLPTESAVSLVRVSWGAVTSVTGVGCDNNATGSIGATSASNRCKRLEVAVSTGSEQVILSNSYLAVLSISSAFLDCPMGGFFQVSLLYSAVNLPTPQAARDATSVLAVESALVGGIVASATIGFAVSRTALMFQLSACAFSDSEPMTRYDSPFRLSFGGMNGAYIRGAVVGNCLLVAAMVVLALCISLVFHVHRRMKSNHETFLQSFRWVSLQSLSAKTHSPSNLVIPGSWILQSTVGACVTLLSEQFDGVGDIFIALAGLALTLGLLFKFYYKLIFRLQGSVHGTRHSVLLPRGRPLLLGDYCEWFMRESVKWRQRHLAQDPRFKHKYFEIFCQYVPEYRWYLVVETGMCVVMGVLAGIRPATDQGCQDVAWVVLAASLAMLLYSGYARPYSTRFDEFILQTNNAFTAICAILLAIPTDSDELPTAADAVAMTQVYVSSALTILWLIHHLTRIKSLVEYVLGREVDFNLSFSKRSQPQQQQLSTAKKLKHHRHKWVQSMADLAMSASELMGIDVAVTDANYLERMLTELNVERQSLKNRLTLLSQFMKNPQKDSEALRKQVLDILIRMSCLNSIQKRIDDALQATPPEITKTFLRQSLSRTTTKSV